MNIHGDFHILPVKATANPIEIGPVDLVLFCTKTYVTHEASQQIRPIIGTATTVMSLQNGVEAAEQIGVIVGRQHMIGATTWISSSVEAPGVIKQVSEFRRIVLGELNGQITPRVQAIFDAFQETDITIEVSESIIVVTPSH